MKVKRRSVVLKVCLCVDGVGLDRRKGEKQAHRRLLRGLDKGENVQAPPNLI